MLDDDRLTSQAMESLIQRKLLTQAADSLGLSISDSQLGALIGNMEQFQSDGQFNPEVDRGNRHAFCGKHDASCDFYLSCSHRLIERLREKPISEKSAGLTFVSTSANVRLRTR